MHGVGRYKKNTAPATAPYGRAGLYFFCADALAKKKICCFCIGVFLAPPCTPLARQCGFFFFCFWGRKGKKPHCYYLPLPPAVWRVPQTPRHPPTRRRGHSAQSPRGLKRCPWVPLSSTPDHLF